MCDFFRVALFPPRCSTYVALYDNHALTDVMQSTGIGFEEYRWHEIPQEVQEALMSLDLHKDSYDTGKVLNLLLLSQGAELLNLDSPALCHIGGTSFQVNYDNQLPSLKGRILNRLMKSKLGAPKPSDNDAPQQATRNATKTRPKPNSTSM